MKNSKLLQQLAATNLFLIKQEKSFTKILLNLGDVSYIDSSGLGQLVSTFTTASNAGAKVKLLNVQKKVSDLLQITKLYTIFESHDNEADAILSFS